MEGEKTLLDRFAGPLSATLWAAAGAIGLHLWARYRGRMITLRWQAFHEALAISAQDVLFGTIEVRYNGNPVQNLHLTTVSIENESNSDLTNLDLNLVFQDGTIIYIAHGLVQGSANVLPFADPFAGDLNRFLKLDPEDPGRSELAAALFARRDFRVPVLNRGSNLRIVMLVQAPHGRRPFIHLACDYAGVKLLFQGPRALIFGVDRNLAALTGLLAGGILVLALTAAHLGPSIGAFAAFLIGCTTAALGAMLIRGLRWLGRVLG